MVHRRQRSRAASIRTRSGIVLAALVVGAVAWLAAGARSDAAASCTKSFVPASGSWTAAGSWSPSGVPTASDYVCIDGGKTANLAVSRTVLGARIEGTVNVTAGVLSLADSAGTSPSELTGSVTGGGELRVVSGRLAVDTATMTGAGTTRVADGAVMTVTSTTSTYGLVLYDTRTVINNGTLRVVGADAGATGYLHLYGAGTTLTNTDTLALRAGADIT